MGNEFAINGFTGLTTNEIISFFLSAALFTALVALVALSLYAFFVASRPIRGRVRTASVWHFVALLWFTCSIISEVWSAPAEKTFVAEDTGQLLDFGRVFQGTQASFFQGGPDARLRMVLVGFVFAGIGIVCMIIGVWRGGKQKRRLLDEEVYAPITQANPGRAVSAARS